MLPFGNVTIPKGNAVGSVENGDPPKSSDTERVDAEHQTRLSARRSNICSQLGYAPVRFATLSSTV